MSTKDKDHQRDLAFAFAAKRSIEMRVLMGSTIVTMVLLLIVVWQYVPFGRFAAKDVLPCENLVQAEQPHSEEGLRDIKNKTTEDVDAKINITRAKYESADPAREEDQTINGALKRVFRPYGSAAYLFIQMGAYRGGGNTFAIVGLASKPLHVFGKPSFQCEWIPSNSNSRPLKGETYRMLPDWGYGRVYTVVVVNCTFYQNVGMDGSGGELILHALPGDEFGKPERIVALTEQPGSLDPHATANFFNQTNSPYDYLYCGSSLYGDLSPQRMREWIAYHTKFFGDRSHFVFHDAGGINPEVRNVLHPWIRAGRVTLQDIRAQEQYDGYYHNQFLVVNDCLHRYKFMAKWTFFFDVDEYLYLPPGNTLESVLRDFSGYSQFTFQQYSMSNKLCLSMKGSHDYSREWGFEKLVFRDTRKNLRRDRKYAVQARNVYATGVHMSENLIGKTLHQTDDKIGYYHYHNSLSKRGEPCSEFIKLDRVQRAKKRVTWFDGIPYVYDGTMKALAQSVKGFERQKIGSVLASTKQ